MLDVIIDTIIDALKMLPFLFLAYLLIEYISHRASDKFQRVLSKKNGLSSVAGALLGTVPQCGFGAAAASLYSNRVITIGTLIAVFLSTSDEAIPVLLTNPNNIFLILKIIAIKCVIAIIAGILIDYIYKNISNKNGKCISEKSEVKVDAEYTHEQCCTHHHDHKKEKKNCEVNIFVQAIKHTLVVLLFITIVSFILNTIIFFIGEEKLEMVLMTNSVLQPFIAGLFGFIPNCVSSALLTQLYLAGTISFGAIIAGLCTSAGIGFIVLFKTNNNIKDNLKIMGIIYIVAIISGMLIQFLGI